MNDPIVRLWSIFMLLAALLAVHSMFPFSPGCGAVWAVGLFDALMAAMMILVFTQPNTPEE